jgi:hypothetical protein
MYVNYKEKLNITQNRPRIFYLNLIEPKISSYYEMIINSYEKLLMKKNEIILLNLYFIILNLNNFKFNKSNTLRIFTEVNDKLVYNMKKIKVMFINKKLNDQRKVKRISESHSKYLMFKEYFKELNRKSNTSFDINTLTM